MDRNNTIRFVLGCAAGAVVGQSAVAAFGWIITSASLSVFVMFLLALITMVLAGLAFHAIGYVLERKLTNLRIDNACVTVGNAFAATKNFASKVFA